jgi:hypothetical protein
VTADLHRIPLIKRWAQQRLFKVLFSSLGLFAAFGLWTASWDVDPWDEDEPAALVVPLVCLTGGSGTLRFESAPGLHAFPTVAHSSTLTRAPPRTSTI